MRKDISKFDCKETKALSKIKVDMKKLDEGEEDLSISLYVQWNKNPWRLLDHRSLDEQ